MASCNTVDEEEQLADASITGASPYGVGIPNPKCAASDYHRQCKSNLHWELHDDLASKSVMHSMGLSEDASAKVWNMVSSLPVRNPLLKIHGSIDEQFPVCFDNVGNAKVLICLEDNILDMSLQQTSDKCSVSQHSKYSNSQLKCSEDMCLLPISDHNSEGETKAWEKFSEYFQSGYDCIQKLRVPWMPGSKTLIDGCCLKKSTMSAYNDSNFYSHDMYLDVDSYNDVYIYLDGGYNPTDSTMSWALASFAVNSNLKHSLMFNTGGMINIDKSHAFFCVLRSCLRSLPKSMLD